MEVALRPDMEVASRTDIEVASRTDIEVALVPIRSRSSLRPGGCCATRRRARSCTSGARRGPCVEMMPLDMGGFDGRDC